MPRFPSPEWARAYCEELNKSESYRRSARGWEWPILFKVRDLPEDLKSLYPSGSPGFVLDLYNGECRSVEWFDDSSRADAPYILSARYRDWVDVIEGRVNPVAAIMRRKLVLEKGSMSVILRYPLAALEMVKAAQRVGLG